jgi:NDP-sugar pyrophosphorylase family protein
MKGINKFLIKENDSIKKALRQLDTCGEKTLFVIKKERLVAALTDGDIRRWILKTGGIKGKVSDICNYSPKYFYSDNKKSEIKELMIEKRIEVIPIIGEDKNIVDIVLWEDVFAEKAKEFKQLDLPVLIMAGGKGTRLDPFTKVLPKALVPIAGKPIIEIIMEEYAKFGIKEFYVSVNHKAYMLEAFFTNYSTKYEITLIKEDTPLGTVGALKKLEKKINTPLFISNCDITIKEDYNLIYEFHNEGKFDLTLVGSMQNYLIPYGICNIKNGGELYDFREKPEYNFLVNTGMYLINPETIGYIPKNEKFQMTDLIKKLKKERKRIGVYPISQSSWIDVGQWSEYRKSIKVLNDIK